MGGMIDPYIKLSNFLLVNSLKDFKIGVMNYKKYTIYLASCTIKLFYISDGKDLSIFSFFTL